jgi:hypothetical protein
VVTGYRTIASPKLTNRGSRFLHKNFTIELSGIVLLLEDQCKVKQTSCRIGNYLFHGCGLRPYALGRIPKMLFFGPSQMVQFARCDTGEAQPIQIQSLAFTPPLLDCGMLGSRARLAMQPSLSEVDFVVTGP